VVIDNFLHKAEDKALVYDRVAEWAASVVQNNIAHIVFLTNDSASTKPLTKALPDRVFKTVSLSDLDPEVAKKFVRSRLVDDVKVKKEEEKEATEAAELAKLDLEGLDESVEAMGGRLTDLEFLSRRIKSGQTPKEAVDEIVSENAVDIVKMYLLGKVGEEDRKWSTQQAWMLVKSLATSPTLQYNKVLLSTTFASSLNKAAKDGEQALEALAGTELISIQYYQGRPQTIKAGKPLNQVAFKEMLKDRVLKAKMDLAVLKENSSVESKSIAEVENELALLGGLPKQTNETANRVSWLLGKLDSSQRKISQLDQEMDGLKKILEKEF
jgi:hypothetical protein